MIEPIVIVKISSANEREMRAIFQRVTQHTNGRQGFVIYDCSEFRPSRRQLDKWVQLQSRGLRGSMTDPTTYTFFVGADEELMDAAEQIERRSEIAVGLYDYMDEAIGHAQDGYRIFSAW